MLPSKDSFALIYTGIITIGFFVAGVFDVLDYFIVQVLLYIGVSLLFIYLFFIVTNNKNKNQ